MDWPATRARVVLRTLSRIGCTVKRQSQDRDSTSIGGRSRTRTYGPLIKSQLLYQLSYAPAIGRHRTPTTGGAL